MALLGSLVLPRSAGAGPATATPTPGLGTSDALRVGFLGRVTTVDPLYVATPAERDLAALLFRGLVRLGPGGDVVGDLASSWEVSESGRVYTFALRPDARWQDGTPVTSADVAFTVRTLQDPAYDGPNGGSWQGVTVTTPDRATVRFDLQDPAAGFIYVAAQGIVPEHALAGVDVGAIRASTFETEPIADGWFKLVQLDISGARLERVRPASSEGPAASFDPLAPPAAPTPAALGASATMAQLPAIEARFYDDAMGIAAAFAAGELDVAGGLPPERAAALAAGTGVRLVRYPQATLTAAILNVRSDQPLFRDVRVRQALLQALDREAIVRDVLHGAGTAAVSPYPPAAPDLPALAAPLPPFDVTAAAKLLTAAGWKRQTDGWHRPGAKEAVAFEVVTVDAESNAALNAVAQRVVAAWRDLGLNVQLSPLTAGDLVQGRLLRHDFQAAVVDMNLGLDPDLMPLLTSGEARRGGSNLAGYQNVAFDGLLEAAHTYAAPEVRQKRLGDVQKAFAAQLPFLPLLFADRTELLRERLQGPSARQLGTPSDRFWDVLTWHLAH
ncbi:MAG: ABC transporter substrate-binding protein [Candidatus Limnocylindrales bacterium]